MLSIDTIRRLANNSKHHQHRHVAVLTRGGAVVAIGNNHDCIHAERKAIKKIWKNKCKGLVLWSYRVNKAGELAMALPCPQCQKLLREVGIERVNYSDANGNMQSIRLASM